MSLENTLFNKISPKENFHIKNVRTSTTVNVFKNLFAGQLALSKPEGLLQHGNRTRSYFGRFCT